MILRPYQNQAEDLIQQALQRVRAVLYVLPTGGGKTVVFGDIARKCVTFGSRVCILVHRDTLLRQACDKLDDFGVDYSIIAPGRTDFGDKVHVASMGTLVRRLGKYDFDLLIIDEGHHAVAGSYKKIIDAYPEASILGVTATPIRLDGKGLGQVFQEIVRGPSIRELIDEGYLTDAVSYGSEQVINLTNARTTGGDYNTKDLQEIMDRREITGSAVDHYRELCPNAPAAAFCVSIKHSEDVAEQFREAGYKSESVNGKMKLSKIREYIKALHDGDLNVVASCDLISEGFDAPGLVSSILLRPTKSLAVYMQQIGRCLRPIFPYGYPLHTRELRLNAIAKSKKPKALILDHAGNAFRFGLVDEPRDWTLDSKKKRSGGSSGPAIRQCPMCYACCTIHKKSCPTCAHVFIVNESVREIGEVKGKLTKLEKVMISNIRRSEESKARSYPELVALGIKRGYHPGWAYRRWLSRGGDPEQARMHELTRSNGNG